MKLYVDTADVTTARRAMDLGVLDGITTNPTLLARAGGDVRQTMRELVDIVDGEVWCQAVSPDTAGLIAEGREIRSWGERLVVKLPMSLAGLQAAACLASEGTNVNMTLIYSVPQALLAAKAGACWISPYVGRIDDTGASGTALIGEMVDALRVQGFTTGVLAASVRGPRHVTELAARGVRGFTMPFELLVDLAGSHLATRDRQRFQSDWESAAGDDRWAPTQPAASGEGRADPSP
jgi:transaldolase